MFKMPAIFFAQLLLSINCFSQALIKGKVVDAASGEAIPGSSVFINNSSRGVISDKAGEFEMTGIPSGNHELIISSIGYETSVFSFSAAQLPLKLKVELRVKVRELQNVTVEPSLEEGWDKWGRIFSESFIGTTPNAMHCKIKNSKAIRFRYFKKTNRVIAYSDEPIIVENKALGYTIRYQLEDFEVNFKSGTNSFAGYPLFTEMDKNRKKWERNRDKAYSGSMMHFMRSLYNGKLSEEGFEVRRMRKILNTEKERVKKVYVAIHHRGSTNKNGSIHVNNKPDSLRQDSVGYYERILRQKDYMEVYDTAILTSDSLLTQHDEGYKVLFFNDYLFITYKKEMEDKAYLDFFHEKRSPVFQRSYIWLTNGNAVTVDENGNYYPPQEIFSMAYWGWEEKMANMLPLEY